MNFVSYRFELVIVLRFFVLCRNIYKLQTDIEYTRVRGSIACYITFALSIYGRRLQSNDKYFNQKCPTNRDSHRSPKAPFDTQLVTALVSYSFAAKRPEIHFCRETWAKVFFSLPNDADGAVALEVADDAVAQLLRHSDSRLVGLCADVWCHSHLLHLV